MKILAIDTTAKTAAIAVTDGKRLLASVTLNTPSTHSVTVLPMVEKLLSEAGMTVSDVDLFACSAGPGSFTGVRIGVSLLKGLAFGTDKPCVGVSSLYALAHNATLADGIICPVMDARRNQLYNALFRCEFGRLTRLTEDRLITADELKKELMRIDLPVRFVGDGCAIAERQIISASDTYGRLSVVPELYRWQNGYSVAMAALEKYQLALDENADMREFTASSLSPVYLRASQAEREREEKLAKGDGN
ncbi:MAG: tRNA (adenosine(37)-N6)-threonylcarbamoyltransferase complex dimerization subunit type 1 TsaB [Clostridia bacterium]|nr:tRNA (adenosine(37)-N6)-threonylcarbamoyltransferase complex dimerization subunit type 1 TsaB [Clostridia bacterium]